MWCASLRQLYSLISNGMQEDDEVEGVMTPQVGITHFMTRAHLCDTPLTLMHNSVCKGVIFTKCVRPAMLLTSLP